MTFRKKQIIAMLIAYVIQMTSAYFARSYLHLENIKSVLDVKEVLLCLK